jgi:hypothetical protein
MLIAHDCRGHPHSNCYNNKAAFILCYSAKYAPLPVMSDQPYRTGTTSLTSDQLVLLDALFDKNMSPRLLSKDGFLLQFNLGYAHSLEDAALERSIESMCEDGILERFSSHLGIESIRVTRRGGELWSQERCPVWDRYCMDSYRDTLRGRTMMTVVAVSVEVRDHFLALWPEGLARRKKATLPDCRQQISWHPFDQVYVGVAIYDEPCAIPCEDPEENNRRFKLVSERDAERWEMLEDERSWWRCVRELQRFVPGL